MTIGGGRSPSSALCRPQPPDRGHRFRSQTEKGCQHSAQTCAARIRHNNHHKVFCVSCNVCQLGECRVIRCAVARMSISMSMSSPANTSRYFYTAEPRRQPNSRAGSGVELLHTSDNTRKCQRSRWFVCVKGAEEYAAVRMAVGRPPLRVPMVHTSRKCCTG